MQLSTSTSGNITTVTVDAETIDAAVASHFKAQMMSVIENSEADVVLDIGSVKMVDSSGLGTLVALLKALGTERNLVLRNPAPSVTGLLKLTRMDRVFKIEVPAQA